MGRPELPLIPDEAVHHLMGIDASAEKATRARRLGAALWKNIDAANTVPSIWTPPSVEGTWDVSDATPEQKISSCAGALFFFMVNQRFSDLHGSSGWLLETGQARLQLNLYDFELPDDMSDLSADPINEAYLLIAPSDQDKYGDLRQRDYAAVREAGQALCPAATDTLIAALDLLAEKSGAER